MPSNRGIERSNLVKIAQMSSHLRFLFNIFSLCNNCVMQLVHGCKSVHENIRERLVSHVTASVQDRCSSAVVAFQHFYNQ